MTPSSHLLRSGCALLLGASLASCSSSDDEPDTTTYRNAGTLCLRPDGDGQTRITVGFGNCLSCNEVVTTSCSATVAGDQITVQSILDVERRDRPEVCPAICAFATATCPVMVASPGEYRIEHGADSAAITLPLTSAVAPYGGTACD